MLPTAAHRRPLIHSAEAREIFISGCEADLQAIRLAQRKRDKDSLQRQLHALKGALIVFGERETATLCEQAEDDLRRHSVSACAATLRRFEDAIRTVIETYKRGCDCTRSC
ncbi:Hpt domain-containing protein [Dyella choica]|nr:Hpt domain-containing protein [Dyella choica]